MCLLDIALGQSKVTKDSSVGGECKCSAEPAAQQNVNVQHNDGTIEQFHVKIRVITTALAQKMSI